MRMLFTLAVAIPLAIVMACGGDDDKPASPNLNAIPTSPALVATTLAQLSTPPASGTPRTPAPGTPAASVRVVFPISNATATRDLLLSVARGADWSMERDPIDPKQYPAWFNVAPDLKLLGTAVVARPDAISVYRNLLNSKDPPAQFNPKVIAFAVMDIAGNCAAGVIRGNPNYDTYLPVVVPSGRSCTGEQVANQVRIGG